MEIEILCRNTVH